MVPKHLSAPARRQQILDEARRLFLTRGYDATTVEDILAAVGIAKGTLYHHFASKEAILEAIVLRTSGEIAERVEVAAADPSLPAIARILTVISSARASEEDIELAQQFRVPENTRFHLLSLQEVFIRLVPVLTRVVEDGVAAGELSTADARSSVEVVLAAGMTLLDGGIFPLDEDDPAASAEARQATLLRTAAALLDADPAVLASLVAPIPSDGDAPGTPAAGPSAATAAAPPATLRPSAQPPASSTPPAGPGGPSSAPRGDADL